jgi:hypothetical protein
VLPALRSRFGAIGVFLTPQSVTEAAGLLRAAGAATQLGSPDLPVGHLHLGLWRRSALALALESFPAADSFLFCDLDRALYGAECYPDLARAEAASAISYSNRE